MALVNGATYRFENRADPNRSLNVYGTSPASLANVCLWTSDDDDICQQWVYRVTGGHAYLLCKGNQNLALDLYTGSGSSTVKNYNAHVCEPSATSYIEIEESDGDYIQIKLENYSNKYLTANQGSNGTSGGKDVNAAGNVYFYNGGLTDDSQDWLPVRLDGGSDPDPDPGDEGEGNGTIIVGQRPSTLNYNRACYGPSFNRFHEDYAPGNGTAQCTWHCYGRAFEVLGKTIQFSGSGGLHGKYWYDRITNGEQSSVPKANSIAVWDDGGSYGHVGYVEKVDSNYVYVSEANWGPDYTMNVLDATDGQVKRFPRDDMDRGSYAFVGYVHLDI